jgi:hypothetical protein
MTNAPISNTGLRRNAMIDLAECFVDAYKHHLDILDPDTQLTVKKFATVIALEKPASLLFSKEQLPDLVIQVFGVPEIRQFIIDLTAGVIIRMGLEDSQMADFNRIMANAFSLYSSDVNENIIPKSLLATSNSVSDLLVLFRDNKWLLTIALIKMFTAIDKPTRK